MNWTRPQSHPVTRAKTFASRVFPSPGLSSKRTCPLASAAHSIFLSTVLSPTNTAPVDSSIRSDSVLTSFSSIAQSPYPV